MGYEETLTLDEYLAIPYVLSVYSAVGDDGRWHRYAEYPEIGCTAEGDFLPDALERLESLRVEYLKARSSAAEPIPVPRAPLRSVLRELKARRGDRADVEGRG